MAETVGRFAPNVTSREIDLSQPAQTEISGIPAGIIGTANEGPAFIPLTVASRQQFINTYGNSSGEKFGPLAVSEWLKNAQAATYIRVLGVGDGKKRNTTTGKVTNAGFVVGDRLVQPSGYIGNNPYATDGSGDVKGRTYFLSCFMSESAGSTIFSDAGIQTSGENKAVSILRGVLLAPSGVILHLSGATHNNANNNAPTKGNTATTSTQGGVTGSVNTASGEFRLLMNGYNNSDASKLSVISASFDWTSPDYFVKKFNKDPFKIEERGHYLYSWYDVHPNLAVITGSGITPIASSSQEIATLLTSSIDRNTSTSTVPNYEDFEDRFSHGKTPFVISQKLGGQNKNLFRLHLISDGQDVANKYKFSIENIIPGADSETYGQFDLLIRDINDSDDNFSPLERWTALSLDPTSDKYISRVIGDQNVYYKFDVNEQNQKIVVEGSHPVNSKYVRVEVTDSVAKGYPAGISPSALPFGFRGPLKLNISGSMLTKGADHNQYYNSAAEGDEVLRTVFEPPIPYRENIAINNDSNTSKTENTNLYWGIQTNLKINKVLVNQPTVFNETFINGYTRHFPTHRLDALNFASENSTAADAYNNNKFTLENILVRTGSGSELANPKEWVSASYSRGATLPESDSDETRYFQANDLTDTANVKYAKFTFFAQGGYNGSNIFNEDKFNFTNNAVSREMIDTLANDVNDNTVKAYRKAIDIMTSKDDVDIQLFAIPGIRNSSVTDYAIQKIENRFDAMYIMDIENVDQQGNVITSSAQQINVNKTRERLTNTRNLDTSFAAAYFPDVNMTNPDSNTSVRVPPSVPVLGAYAYNDSVAHPWFAPAGFNRGSLSSITSTTVNLKPEDLDNLYAAGINPIAEFVGNGITIWGQKTLQAKSSALDRINVRRLLIDVRRKVKAIANTLLFEPNREETLDKFSSLVNPILQRIQSQGGVERYKAVIDTSTTTQADVENNTIRGKIFLQPVRSIEYISLDFVVTNNSSNN